MAGATGWNLHHTIHLDDHMESHPSQLHVHLLMITCQVLWGIYYVITRVALINGLNRIVLSLYRDILAMVFLIPAAYFVDKGNRLTLSVDVLFQLLLLGLTGIYGSNYLLFVGIEYTSAEVSAAAQPAIPVLTALIAMVFGVEVVRWYRRDGQAKVLGIVFSCTGAIVMTLYRGPAVTSLWNSVGKGWSPLVTTLKDMSFAETGFVTVAGWRITGWQFGTFCLIGNCVCMASFINLQAPLLKKHPSPVTILAYAYGFGAVLMAVTGYFAVTESSDWAPSLDVNLVAVIYNGVIASALNFGIMSWCLARVGPLFVASYIPLQPVVSAILATIFLCSTIYVGSILGTVLVIAGLLLVSWSREENVRLALLSRHIATHQRSFFKSEADAIREPLFQIGR